MFNKKNLIFSIIILKVYSLNEECFHQDLNKKGRCVPLKNCPRSKQSKNSVFLPQICEENLKNQNYVVCCPLEGEIFKEKCTIYRNQFQIFRIKRQIDEYYPSYDETKFSEKNDSSDYDDTVEDTKLDSQTEANDQNIQDPKWKEHKNYKIIENTEDFSEYEDIEKNWEIKKPSTNCNSKASANGVLLLFNNCEEKTGEKEIVQTIIGGENAEIGQFPFMAAIGFGKVDNIKWACGGTLISDKFVLTAAHCSYDWALGKAKFVQLGDIRLNGPSSKLFFIRRSYLPPGYTQKEKYNDIALLQLTRVVPFSKTIFPACLLTNDNKNLFKNFESKGLGWGRTEKSDQSDFLQVVTLQYFENCKDYYKKLKQLPKGINDDSQICFGHKTEEKDTCTGDSGGPLIYFDGVYNVFGVTSFGKSCGTVNYPAVYTRVSHFIEWIEGIIWPK